jgi:hypothetical protein
VSPSSYMDTDFCNIIARRAGNGNQRRAKKL